jgi:hypothetical protein
MGILATSIVDLYAELPYFVTFKAHEFRRGIMIMIREIQRICKGYPPISSKALRESSITPPFGQISTFEHGITCKIGRTINQMIRPIMP